MQEYRVLARKYRPSSLGDLSGQDVLVKTMTNAIESNRIHHAFLFTGTRGVGKTTSARIIALSVNCIGEDGLTDRPVAKPCLKCFHCVQILAGNHPDVIEFDAASKTGIDSMREVIDSCSYPPISARNKVYIIDEVHMLSKSAFNALLKTLEEPPANIKFIFATTEIKKVPVTIVSRCQKFVLRNFTLEGLADYLSNIAKKEGFEIEPGAVHILARMAAGSARDGLSLLDQAMLMSEGGLITEEQTLKMLAVSDQGLVCDLFVAVVEQDRASIERILSEVVDGVADLSGFVTDLLGVISVALRFLSYGKFAAEAGPVAVKAVEGVAEKINAQMMFRAWHIAIVALDDLKIVNTPTVLDVMVAKMLFAVEMPLPSEILQHLQTEAQEEAERLFSSK